MDGWKKDARRDVVIVDIDALVQANHLPRKIERVTDYDWLYEWLDPYYCHEVGRPGTDPVVLIKMALIQHLFGIPSLRQIYRQIQDTLSYRWFLGYGLLDDIPHFATVSYAFCKRFPPELSEEIYAKSKETIERAFADAKEKHAMRYAHRRGLARVTSWVRLKYAAMNLKDLAN